MDNAIIATLEQSGFTDKEAKVYAALLELGQGDVTDISQYAEIGRSNIYVILDKLAADGYVSRVPNKTVRQYTPADPTRVFNHLQNSAMTFKQMLPILQSLYSRPGGKPRMQYFEGGKALLGVLREVNQHSYGDFIASIARLQQHIPEEVEQWRRLFRDNVVPMRARALLTDTPQDRQFMKDVAGGHHQIRFLPKHVMLEMDFALYGENLALTSLGDPLFVTVIQSPQIHRSLTTVFELLWKAGTRR